MSMSFFQCLFEMESILSSTKAVDHKLQLLQPLLADEDVQREFWKQLHEPEWINALDKAGYFGNPPPATESFDGRIRAIGWPQSQFLARVAGKASREVASILSNIQTENASVIGDMAKAAIEMPADLAAQLNQSICKAALEGKLAFHFRDAARLCAFFAENGQLASAMELADALFTPRQEHRNLITHSHEDYSYKDGLRKVAPALTSHAVSQFLPRLCLWLERLLQLQKHVNEESGDDFSHVWRPAIEEHEENSDYDLAGFLVGVLRQSLEQAVRDKQLSLESALSLLDEFHYVVFKRFRIHLVAEFAEDGPHLARHMMLDRESFDGFEYKHEYAMLLKRRFGMLDSNDTATWYSWVDDGPDMQELDESFVWHRQRRPTETERQEYSEQWKYRKLHWVKDYLDDERRVFYTMMVAKYGEPEFTDLSVRSSRSRSSRDSVFSVEQLQGMTFEQALETVSSWHPSEFAPPSGPTIEDVAVTFKEFVATDPESFSKQSHQLKGKPRDFVRHFINQMSEATKAGARIDLAAVIDLCHWVLTQADQQHRTPSPGQGSSSDAGWEWSRDAVCQFAEKVCEAEVEERPFYGLGTIRSVLWSLIEQLCKASPMLPVVRDEPPDPRLEDYLQFAVNAPRGKAVQAALAYARWVRNNLQETKPGGICGFEDVPEVRDAIEWQLAPGNRTVEALAILGSRVGFLFWLDKKWLAENAQKIFDLVGIDQEPRRADGWAAWNAFLGWVSPHIEFYRLFKDEYSYAVNQAAKATISDRQDEQPMNHLGEHLVILYGRGQLDFEEDGGLLREFIQTANPDVRRHAIGFIGQTLPRDQQVPLDIIDRFMRLWEFYWAGPGKNDAIEKPHAWLLGGLVATGQFPPEWSLRQLFAFTETSPLPEPDQMVAERLVDLAAIDIHKVMIILDRMVRADGQGWTAIGWLDTVKKILNLAIKEEGDTRDRALALIDYLGRCGYVELGQLLR